MQNNNFFITIPCPLCGSEEYKVVYPGTFPEVLDQEFLKNVYCSSSEHSLFEQVVECSKCQLVYLNPRLQENLIVDSYAEGEDLTFILQDAMRIRTFRKSLRKILDTFSITSDRKKVLDVGCAGGAFLRAAGMEGLRVTGIEPSKWLGEYGRREYGLDIRTGVLEGQDFPEKSFDIITMWDVIEHVPNPHRDLKHIHTLLKDEGIFIVNYPDFGSFPAMFLGRRWPFLLSVHLVYYTPSTIKKQLALAGFQIIDLKKHWQILELGYILRRAGSYFVFFQWLEKIVVACGLEKVPIVYWIGQTQVIAKKC